MIQENYLNSHSFWKQQDLSLIHIYIVNIEKPDGAVVQFGGQTAIKLTEALMKMGVKILGTSAEDVDAAEEMCIRDRYESADADRKF